MKWLISIAATFFVIVIAISVFLAPDSLVDCGDTPSGESGCQKADAIIAVSGGDTQARTEEAIALYQNGWADKLIFSGAASDKSGPSNAAVMRQLAIKAGISPTAIVIEQNSETTKQNAEKTIDILQSSGIKSALLVSSSYHQKRVLIEFRRRAPNIEFRSHPVPDDKQWSQNWWWLTPGGWYLALSEVVKIIIVQTGGSR